MILTGTSSLLRRTAAAAARAPTSQAPASLAIASTSVAASSTILPAFAFGGSIQTRNSTKRGGGSTKNNRNSPGKRLGYKKQTGQLVYPGQIIFRQRGTSWHPGLNTAIGKDHTIFATAPGYVHFYYSNPTPSTSAQAAPASSPSGVKLPIKKLSPTTFNATALVSTPHPSSKKQRRRYIAVSADPETTFPLPAGTPRERRFDRVDLNSLQSQIDQLKIHQQAADNLDSSSAPASA
ncbi:mitochondrial 54S ribosomal protein YmL2 [Moesziomyces antarcticus]|uniref:Related to MRP7 - mitochondrial ribosomal protein, large subunit n=2 Tax=Pseudozyma antarctica TaxID=84753 RepID=A0A5C3FTY0_PSEA2|nr:mitochondrial 54S ribosomal protein YmL2 [Moesziomyces antarcticus]GAK66581.1 mitochondrial 54S ribosomal protein YmL2 [Moesziomyces antarcticus]SPO47630.1 related to MRP7 - mitochondrial ribosomal protein, large subunit [Moesziomyces antarcticus]